MNRIFGIMMLGAFLAITSCKEQGCTDDKATNFNADAEVDDESCTFSGDIVFWCDSARNRELIAEGFNTPMNISIGGEKIGSLNFYNYLKKAPNCTDSYSSSTYEEVVNYNHAIDKSSASVSVVFEDNAGKKMTTRIVTVNSGDCSVVKL